MITQLEIINKKYEKHKSKTRIHIMMSLTLDDITEKFVYFFISKNSKGLRKCININKLLKIIKKITFPLENINIEELKIYFKATNISKISYSCSIKDEKMKVIKQRFSRLEMKYPGIKYQTLSFIKKLKDIL
jgi:hypothetical protein